jgi:hypothetical protein
LSQSARPRSSKSGITVAYSRFGAQILVGTASVYVFVLNLNANTLGPSSETLEAVLNSQGYSCDRPKISDPEFLPCKDDKAAALNL